MEVIIALVLSSISIVISVFALIFSLRRLGLGGKNSNKSGTVYCSNCCQPYDASMKVCPKCGTPKKNL